MNMKQAMKERHMVRKYTDKPIPEDIVSKLNDRVMENNERYGLSIRLMTNGGSAVPGVIKLILAKGVNNFFSLDSMIVSFQRLYDSLYQLLEVNTEIDNTGMN